MINSLLAKYYYLTQVMSEVGVDEFCRATKDTKYKAAYILIVYAYCPYPPYKHHSLAPYFVSRIEKYFIILKSVFIFPVSKDRLYDYKSQPIDISPRHI